MLTKLLAEGKSINLRQPCLGDHQRQWPRECLVERVSAVRGLYDVVPVLAKPVTVQFSRIAVRISD
jgi:hypothetical protein